MPEELPRIYCDADVFLSYINGIAERLPNIEALLEKSGTDLQIITSSISVVEVAFGKAEQDGKALDAEIEARINALWSPESPVRLVEFYPMIAEGAKTLLRESIARGWKLKPMDAIHLSTARQERVTDFHTYDDLAKYSAPGPSGEPPILNFRIGPPEVRQPKLPGT
jgi:predicted nucleic acid-binding protein